jgi:hypothetical protein
MADLNITADTIKADITKGDTSADTYDRVTLKAAQLEALLAATVDDTLDGLTPALRSAYLSACADAATEVRTLLGKLAPVQVAAALT